MIIIDIYLFLLVSVGFVVITNNWTGLGFGFGFVAIISFVLRYIQFCNCMDDWIEGQDGMGFNENALFLLVPRGNAIIAELLRLSDHIPPAFLV